MKNANELNYPCRLARLMKTDHGIVVAAISMQDRAPLPLDKRQVELGIFGFEAVGSDVRVGMVQQPDGSFAFPAGHPDEPVEVVRARRQAEQAEQTERKRKAEAEAAERAERRTLRESANVA